MPIYLRLRTYPSGRPAFVLPQSIHPPFEGDESTTTLRPWGHRAALRVAITPQAMTALWRRAIDAHLAEKYTDHEPHEC